MSKKKYRVILGSGENEITSSILKEKPSEEEVKSFAAFYQADFSRLVELDPIAPSDGGCWFCHTNEHTDLVFDSEFDTFVHLDCIGDELTSNPDNPEAKLMSYLLD